MSAPQTNIEKQKRRHSAPLIGMIVVVLFGVAMIVWWGVEQAARAPGPDSEESQVDADNNAPVLDATPAPATDTAGGEASSGGGQPGVAVGTDPATGSSTGTVPSVGGEPPAGSEVGQ